MLNELAMERGIDINALDIESTSDEISHRLDRLRRKIEQVFPNARNFKRPGFDDMN